MRGLTPESWVRPFVRAVPEVYNCNEQATSQAMASRKGARAQV